LGYGLVTFGFITRRVIVACPIEQYSELLPQKIKKNRAERLILGPIYLDEY